MVLRGERVEGHLVEVYIPQQLILCFGMATSARHPTEGFLWAALRVETVGRKEESLAEG